jgi:hypothetical protein
LKKQYVIWILILSCSGTQLFGQLSPGDLSEAHKHLEGVGLCTECHLLGDKVTDQRCLDCHVEIQSLIDADRGYHVSVDVEGKKCVDCHSEHHGRSFDLFRLDEDKFDHNLTGYELVGEHWVIDCRECHKADNIANLDIKKLDETYLGLEEDCLSCHNDYHQETLGDDCIKCHNFKKWAPAELFDHADAEFKLRGAHKEVDCLECHAKEIRNDQEFQVFTGLEFGDCIDCHESPHNESFSTNCTDCHNEWAWSDLNSGIKFNHDITNYPLTGLHIGVDCRECHTSGKNTDKIEFAECRDCHQDYHNKQFTSRDSNADCNDCHSLDMPFTSTLFGLEEHQESDYKLEGAHVATPCFACHVSDEERWEFRDIGQTCVDCHENIHREVISEKFYPEEECIICHLVDSWRIVDFDHTTTNWDLEGAHNSLECRECHIIDVNGADVVQEFYGLSSTCVDCHEDEHGGQFGLKPDCKECHGAEKGWEALYFDHNETNFPLEGKHIDVDCSQCHKSLPFDGGEERVEYKIEKFECIDCHS